MDELDNFLFFMFNNWTKDTCNEIYGELGVHIWNKWLYAKSFGFNAIWIFMTSLDSKHRNMLLESIAMSDFGYKQVIR